MSRSRLLASRKPVLSYVSSAKYVPVNRAYLDQRGMFRRIVLPRIGVMKVTVVIPPQNRAS